MSIPHRTPVALRQGLCLRLTRGLVSRVQLFQAIPKAWLNLHRGSAGLGKTQKGTTFVLDGNLFSGPAALPGTQFRDFTCSLVAKKRGWYINLCFMNTCPVYALEREGEKGSESRSKETQG